MYNPIDNSVKIKSGPETSNKNKIKEFALILCRKASIQLVNSRSKQEYVVYYFVTKKPIKNQVSKKFTRLSAFLP